MQKFFLGGVSLGCFAFLVPKHYKNSFLEILKTGFSDFFVQKSRVNNLATFLFTFGGFLNKKTKKGNETKVARLLTLLFGKCGQVVDCTALKKKKIYIYIYILCCEVSSGAKLGHFKG